MKNLAILSFLLSLFLVACGDDSSSSVSEFNEESELSSNSSSKANKSSNSSSSSSKKVNNSSNSSSSSSSKANNSSNSSSSSSKKANKSSNSSSSSSEKAETVPKDFQNWKDTTEGAIRKSDITDTIYIFDNKKWRVATLPEASLGGCNEKKVNFFGYAEERETQDMTDPRVNECIERTHSSECGNDYYPGYYICRKDYGNKKFYWEHLNADYYDDICNDSSYYANSNEGDAHWGSIEPVKTKCINCKQQNFDYLENICKKHCYVLDGKWRIGHATECALGFGGCTTSRLGTTNEGPVIKTAIDNEYVGYESYIYYSYVTSIDSTQKTQYICWNSHEVDEEFFLQWYKAEALDNDFYFDIYPAECTYDLEGQIIAGKKHKYVCDDENLRIATQEEIDAGFACTSYLRYQKKCGTEQKE